MGAKSSKFGAHFVDSVTVVWFIVSLSETDREDWDEQFRCVSCRELGWPWRFQSPRVISQI